MKVVIKRVYEKPTPADGKRILVDRLWPRGLTKKEVHIDLWLKNAAPSNELRKWYGHIPEKWPEFQRRYRKELVDNPAIAELRKLSSAGQVTLIYAAADQNHTHALVLRDIINRNV